MLKTPAGRLTLLMLLGCVVAVSGCATFREEPAEPLAEAIPQAPGLDPQFARPGSQQPETQAAATDLDAQSQELERRIAEVKRQRRELERITEEIKTIIKSMPREP